MPGCKRTILIASLVLALLPSVTLADLSGTRQMERDNKRCARYGQHYDRDGAITVREQRKLDKINCKRSGAAWVSSLYYSAEV